MQDRPVNINDVSKLLNGIKIVYLFVLIGIILGFIYKSKTVQLIFMSIGLIMIVLISILEYKFNKEIERREMINNGNIQNNRELVQKDNRS